MRIAKRNKDAGHRWERACVEKCEYVGFEHAITTRQGSRDRDAQKVDIMNADEDNNGRMFLNIQCKTTVPTIQYGKLLGEMPQGTNEINVIFHNQTRKVNERFMSVGQYALLELDDFLEIVEFLNKHNYNEYRLNRREVV